MRKFSQAADDADEEAANAYAFCEGADDNLYDAHVIIEAAIRKAKGE